MPEDATEVATTQVDFAETLLNIIPKNIFTSLSAGDMLPIIFFALFVGILLAAMGNRVSTVANFFSQFNDIMMEMTIAVMKAAPIGVFCLIAKTFAGIGFDAFVPMLKYMGSVILALAVQCFVVYQVMLFVFTRLNPFKFIKKFFPVMTFAFSTSTSNATIPLSIDTLYKKIGVSKQISSFTIPLGATINMDGTSIMQGVAVVFIAQAYGIPLTPAAIATVIPPRRSPPSVLPVSPVSVWHLVHGTDLRGTAYRRHCTDHGYRPYPRHAQNRSQHHRRCSMYYHHCHATGRI